MIAYDLDTYKTQEYARLTSSVVNGMIFKEKMLLWRKLNDFLTL